MTCNPDFNSSKHNTTKAFSEYMENLAALHVDLSHSDGEKHFFRGELSEFYAGFRDSVNFPALILEGSELQFTSDQAHNSFKIRDTSFMIVQHYAESDDYDAIAGAFDFCEQIGDDIFRKINSDKYDPCCMVIKDFHFDDVSAFQIQNEKERYAGWRYTIAPKTPFCDLVNEDKWKK